MINHLSKFAAGMLVFLSVAPLLHAQARASRKFEAGVGYSLIQTNFLAGTTESGLTTRVGYSFYDYLAVEAELNLFPRDLGVVSKGMTAGLFGPKAGWRSEKIGIFGKIRPGFIHFHEQREPFPCIAVFPPPLACVLGGKTEFALDSGGVVEFYPHRRMTLRFDVGDTMIRFRVPVRRFGQPGPDRVVPSTIADGFWSHNFQFGTSIGFRF